MTVRDVAQWPGKKFGATESGIGSVASMGARMGAFLIDIALSAAAGLAITWPDAPGNVSLLVWVALTVLTVGLFGSSPGQWVLGIRVASIHGAALVGAWAVPRTALVFLVLPPLVTDPDGRGWHDKLCRTIVVRTRE